MDEVIESIEEELSDSVVSIGYRQMHQQLVNDHTLTIERETVCRALKVINPDRADHRISRKLKRRQYSVLGPNNTWHIDGYDKFKPFGLVMYHAKVAATCSRSKQDRNESSSNTDSEFVSLSVVRESSIKSFFATYIENSNNRIDNLIQELQGLKSSLEFTQSKFDEYVKANPTSIISDCESKLSAFSVTIADSSKRIESLEAKLGDLENRSRRNNLVFEGIEEEPHETWEITESKLRSILSSKMLIETTNETIERAHRIGKYVSRSIIAKFSNFKTCGEIMKEKKRLIGSKIYVREDFSDKIMAKRRELLPKMHEARWNGLAAYIRYDKLVTRSKVNN